MLLDTILNDDLKTLRAEFVARGHDLRFVGGCVRDLLNGDIPKDTDLCTDATPDEQIEIYKAIGVAYYETGLAHGTISVRFDQEVYEITSLRTETDHDGRHAVVSYTRDWMADLGRRDLTINAMALTFDGDLIDPFGGREDLMNKIVRFVGNPDDRMREDYLRILRWLRFHGRLASGTPLDPETVEAAQRQAVGLRGISRERVWMEMAKIIAGPAGPALIDSAYDLGLAGPMDLPLGDVDRLTNVARFTPTRNPVTLMVALLGAEATGMAAKWKWSAEERDLALFLSTKRKPVNIDFHSWAEYLIAHDGKPMDWVIELMHLNLRSSVAEALGYWTVPVFPVTGQDLIDSGMKPGKELGDKLREMKAAWAANGYKMP